MGKELERDLGLYAVVTISMGAMIGSGIFVLPGLAAKIAGPAVILAYLLAGVIVLPAALSKAEMATAMPEAGGTYLYIDRAMGPLMGTIAGFGAWFSLTFKSAFALVGLGAYVLLFLPSIPTTWVALGLAAALVAVNALGAKQTGNLQALIVTAVLLVLAVFILDGMTFVEASRFHPGFFAKGLDGLLAATGFVFVSYAGVTKIASVAEEVEDPGRTIPMGILVSIVAMMLLYTMIVFVVVGVTDPDTIAKSLTPMADAASAFLGPVLGGWGPAIIAGTAVLALTSMANAGILASSRFPFAMSRDDLVPRSLARISERFRTPITAIAVTGLLLLVLIAFVPVIELAKLASAFKILVFSIINLAVIAFREGQALDYEPEFESPGYPWIQLAGVLAGGVLLTQMGTVPLVGAVGIIAFGGLWYRFYARPRTTREGAGVDAIRRQDKRRAIELTEVDLEQAREHDVLVPVRSEIAPERERLLVRVACDVVDRRGGSVRVIRFDEVPEQMGLSYAREETTEADRSFEAQTDAIVDEFDVPVEIGEVVSHDTPRAVLNYVNRHGIDKVVADAEFGPWSARLFRDDLDAFLDDAPCDVVLVKRNQGLVGVHRISVVSTGAPFDPVKVRVADAIAQEAGADIDLVQAVDVDASDAHLRSVRDYHKELEALSSVPTRSVVVRDADPIGAVLEEIRGTDLVVVGGPDTGLFGGRMRRDSSSRIAEAQDATTLIVYPSDQRRPAFLRRLVNRMLYRE